jgi:hypothetical protein
MIFERAEFIIGDSAFNPSKRMISAYKRNAGESCLKAENEFFNTKMSSARFKSEHCIGLIKNRFPCLRGLNVRIKKPRDVKKVVQIFTACIILHNLLLSESDIPEEWYEVCEEDMGNDVESDILYGGDRCAGDEDRRGNSDAISSSLISDSLFICYRIFSVSKFILEISA